MAVLDWDHNAYYQRLLLRQMPQPGQRVLDVGCGAGAFAARLAQQCEHVDALDRSPEMIREAKRRTPGNVNCVLADVLTDPLPGKDYDAIFSISALHHMLLQDTLPVLAAALRPGGDPCLRRAAAAGCSPGTARRDRRRGRRASPARRGVPHEKATGKQQRVREGLYVRGHACGVGSAADHP